MGNYEEQLASMILALVASILAQILNLLIKNALESCLEEDSALGPGGRPPNLPPDIPMPVLSKANFPKFGDLPKTDIVAWMKDILDNISTAQLCALLRGDATKQTLRQCLSRTKSNWPQVYKNGVDTIYEIRVAFEKLAKT